MITLRITLPNDGTYDKEFDTMQDADKYTQSLPHGSCWMTWIGKDFAENLSKLRNNNQT